MHSGKLQNVLYVSSVQHNVMYCFAVDAIIQHEIVTNYVGEKKIYVKT